MPNTAEQRAQVLIVGAGPVGLALAIELGHRGISCLLVERNDRVGHAPRAKTTNVRTREHFRRWGIADDLRAASPFGVSHPSDIVLCTRLGGFEITRFENAFYCAPGRNPLYAEHSQWIPQYKVEEVMRRHIESLDTVELRFQTEFLGLRQDESGVTAQLRDSRTGAEIDVVADFMVGADGAGSSVRRQLGIRLEGVSGLSRNYNIVFRAPGLAQAHAMGPAAMYWQINADVPSAIGPMDQGDVWFFMPMQVPADVQISHADAPDLIRRATGIDLPYEILSSDEWTASRLLADRYRSGRVFLAGDACHLHPPTGGYGMNMGVADGVDLGWKMAAVLQGWGGAALLDSYELERRPVHQMVLDEAVANHSTLPKQMFAPGMEEDSSAGAGLRREAGARIQAAKMREFSTLGVVKGYRYEQSPVIVGDGTPAPGHDFINYVQTSRPGSVAPHAWLHDGSSLYDRFGAGFTLLASRNVAGAQIEAIRGDAAAAGVPLTVLQREEPAMSELYPQELTLIRPDQHVAWRGDRWVNGADRLFERITGRMPTAVSEEKA